VRTLKADREAGELVETEKVLRFVAGAYREARQAMLRLPDRLATELWQEQDEHRVRMRLKEEVNVVLRDLAERIRKLGPLIEAEVGLEPEVQAP
jgi:hypothetical protein